MADFLGPANADGAVTARPGDTRVFGGADSWFRDCTDPALDDGTEYTAAFTNDLIANLRALARANGGTVADPTIKIVPEVGGNDSMLLAAVQHLVQRGQLNYALAAGSANAITVTLAPVPPELKIGMVLRVKIAAPNTGPVTLNVNGLGAQAVVPAGGVAFVGGEFAAGMVVELVYDGASWQFASIGPSSSSGGWRVILDQTIGASISNVIQTVPGWASILRISTFNPGIVGTARSASMRVSFDGTTFISGAGTYTFKQFGTISNANMSATAMMAAVACDDIANAVGFCETLLTVGSASRRVSGFSKFATILDQSGSPAVDEGITYGACLASGRALAIQIIGAGYSWSPNGANVPEGMRLIIEGRP